MQRLCCWCCFGGNRHPVEKPLLPSSCSLAPALSFSLAPALLSRAAHADALVLKAQQTHDLLAFHRTLAYSLQNNKAYSVDQRAANVANMLQEDSKRNEPWIDVGFELGVRVAWVVQSIR
jgi:hypothetical protein